jgi:hypothetical protein
VPLAGTQVTGLVCLEMYKLVQKKPLEVRCAPCQLEIDC